MNSVRDIVQPTRGRIVGISIGDVPNVTILPNGEREANYHIKEFRIYEDICKSYFTAQLIIETLLNVYDFFLQPTAETFISFECPRSDNVVTQVYTERFRVFSYDSRPIGSGADARIEHTISLIGQEYYNDKHNVVTQNFQNITGTAAAASIHKKYMQSNGPISVFPSSGMIGSERYSHQVLNKKPIKAIHDILDRCVFGQAYKTCAPLYFRRKQGYVIAPLQYQLEHGPITGSFKHILDIGHSLDKTLFGYDNIISLRPLAPSGETSPGVSAGEVSGMMKASSFLDLQSGNIRLNDANFSKILKLPFMKNVTKDVSSQVKKMLAEARKGKRGAMNLFNILDELMQNRAIDKNGPGGYKVAQEALITALTYSQKYWVSVPAQTGLNVTAGDRIDIIFPINGRLVNRRLFVPRLIHEYRVTEGDNRKILSINGKTEIYGVYWGA